MECTDNATKLVISDGNNHVECSYGETVPLGNINITCPDPSIICPLTSEYDPSTGLPVWAIGVISGSAGVVTGAVSISIAIIFATASGQQQRRHEQCGD